MSLFEQQQRHAEENANKQPMLVNHQRTQCSKCDARMHGARYKCLQCAQYSLCAQCYETNVTQHAYGEHCFVVLHREIRQCYDNLVLMPMLYQQKDVRASYSTHSSGASPPSTFSPFTVPSGSSFGGTPSSFASSFGGTSNNNSAQSVPQFSFGEPRNAPPSFASAPSYTNKPFAKVVGSHPKNTALALTTSTSDAQPNTFTFGAGNTTAPTFPAWNHTPPAQFSLWNSAPQGAHPSNGMDEV